MVLWSVPWPEGRERSQTSWSNWSNRLADPGKLVGVVQRSQVGAIHEGEVFPHGVARSYQNGVEVECVAEVFQ